MWSFGQSDIVAIRYGLLMELAKVVNAAATGDERAWRRLAARLMPRLHRRFGSRLHGFDRDALVQDTLIVVWNKLPDFEMRSDAAFMRWVYKIAQFMVLAALRQREHEARLLQALAREDQAPGTWLDSLVARAERVEMVLREADKLPESYRRAIENMIDGGDDRDLAKRAGIELGSARRAMSRAVGRLRERLRPDTRNS
jgi:RNA polymerase sigma factor (sigma-70 family)